MTDHTAPELKPCPFCKGEAEGGFFAGDYDISCDACRFSISRHASDYGGDYEAAKAEAIAAWNTRAEVDALVAAKDAEIARLTALLTAMRDDRIGFRHVVHFRRAAAVALNGENGK